MIAHAAIISKAGGRNVNEDYSCYAEKGGFGCYLLADGLGGHKGGELASRTIGEAVKEAFTASPGFSTGKLIEYIEYARQAFLTALSEAHGPRSMKTTVVVLLTDGHCALWGHIGDSRLYYFRRGSLLFQTKDHSVPQLLADSGEIREDQIRFHEDRNRLTAAFDGNEMTRFTVPEKPVALNSGDAFLLCSDGFWEYVTESEMETVLKRTRDAEIWIAELEKVLLERAETEHDNYSGLAVIIE